MSRNLAVRILRGRGAAGLSRGYKVL